MYGTMKHREIVYSPPVFRVTCILMRRVNKGSIEASVTGLPVGGLIMKFGDFYEGFRGILETSKVIRYLYIRLPIGRPA